MGVGPKRVSERSRATLRALAERSGRSMQAVLDEAIEAYRRRRFLEGLNADFAALRGDKKKWKEELVERRAWDRTLADGLEDD